MARSVLAPGTGGRLMATPASAPGTATPARTDRNPMEAIRTASGILFWPFDPRPEDIYLEDIAHHLSHLCRFTGASRRFYSVAQHSWLVSVLCAPEDALYGLLHDASEAYLNDIARPVKRRIELAGYRDAEHRLQAVIYRRFGLSAHVPASVKKADELALHAELRDLIEGRDPKHVEASVSVRAIVAQRPELARHLFAERFHQLTRKV